MIEAPATFAGAKPETPRLILRLWTIVRDGLPSIGRYRRYIAALAGPLAIIWGIAIAYIALTPDRFDSRMTLILPGSGVGATMNLESIGQASASTTSAFSSATLSPTENYKRLLMSHLVLEAAAQRTKEDVKSFPEPSIKLVDQTNLIEVRMPGGSADQAQERMEALSNAFRDALENLREDEASSREDVDSERIAELRKKVDEAQQALLKFQSRTGLVSLDQFASRMTALDQLKTSEREQRVQLAASNSSTKRLGSTLNISLGQARKAMQLKADPEFNSLLKRYAATTGEHSESSATLGDAHATIEELAAEKASLRSALSRRGKALTGMGGNQVIKFADLAVSDTRESLFASLSERDSNRAGNGAAVAELRRQIAAQSSKTRRQVGQAAELANLTRDLRVAEAVFSSALAQLDTNKSDRFASYPLVQTLEAPSLPREKSGPSALIAIAGAIGASLFTLIGFLLLWMRQPIIRKLLPNA
ncbi:MAG: hypothetical protein ABJP34_01130 [Erythrobacter sp.]